MGDVVHFKTRTNSSARADLFDNPEITRQANTFVARTSPETIDQSARLTPEYDLPRNADQRVLPVERLYPDLEGGSSYLGAAVRLLSECEKLLEDARDSLQADEKFAADDAMLRFKAILPELYCMRSLGESFGTLVNSFFNMLCNLNNAPASLEQIEVLKSAVSRLKDSPFLEYNEVVAIVMRLESSGLDAGQPGMIVLQEQFVD